MTRQQARDQLFIDMKEMRHLKAGARADCGLHARALAEMHTVVKAIKDTLGVDLPF